MTLRHNRWLDTSRMLALVVPSVMGCPGGSGDGGGIPGHEATSEASTLDGEFGLDSTGSPMDPCADDYGSNHSLPSAFSLGLESTDMIRGTFGDGAVQGTGNEQGQDHLIVCPGSPDFFTLDVACAGFVGVVLRRLGDGDVELHIYDPNGGELDGSLDAWGGFAIQPIHRFVEAGEYVIEARHSGGGAQDYWLDVYVLPTLPCS